jgi:hypothetical protein
LLLVCDSSKMQFIFGLVLVLDMIWTTRIWVDDQHVSSPLTRWSFKALKESSVNNSRRLQFKLMAQLKYFAAEILYLRTNDKCAS